MDKNFEVEFLMGEIDAMLALNAKDHDEIDTCLERAKHAPTIGERDRSSCRSFFLNGAIHARQQIMLSFYRRVEVLKGEVVPAEEMPA